MKKRSNYSSSVKNDFPEYPDDPGVYSGEHEEAQMPAHTEESERVTGVVDGMTGTFRRIDPQEIEENTNSKLPWRKRPIVRKICYGLISILIALTLWGYVLMTENPVRIKTVEDVRLSFEGGGEADLKARGLIVSGDISSQLPNVDVNVRTTLNDLPRFNSSMGDVVTATVALNDIREAGTYTRKIVATSAIGTVDSVVPSSITIVVEDLVYRNIPVTCSFENSLPDGYWRGEPQLATSSITISGPESAISSIRSANCVIDLSDRTSEINESYPVVLLDEDKNIVDSSAVVDVIPSVIVRMSILPILDVPVHQYINTIGSLNSDFNLVEISISPETLTLAAPQSVLDTLAESIVIDPVNLSSYTAPGTYTQRATVMGLPSDSLLLSDNSFILTIVIEDRIVTRTVEHEFSTSDIVGERADTYQYYYKTELCTLTFTGLARYINSFREEDVSIILDVSSYGEGAHSVSPLLKLEGTPSWMNDPAVTITISPIEFTIFELPIQY